MERAATADETKKISALLREAVAAGALGFSHTTGIQHVGYKGRPLACRLADRAAPALDTILRGAFAFDGKA